MDIPSSRSADETTLSRQITDSYSVGLVASQRHVEITDATIKPQFLGATSYFVSCDRLLPNARSAQEPTRRAAGVVFDNTVDFASSALGSDIDLLRATGRVSYYLSFAPDPAQLEGENLQKSDLQKWFERSLLAFGARAGIVYPLDTAGSDATLSLFPSTNGFSLAAARLCAASVSAIWARTISAAIRSAANTTPSLTSEYTFPIYGELLGAVFVDAGNLLPDARSPGLGDMRYGVGVGLRYNLPIGPVRLDYGVNPSPRADEDFGAFHFSFGFAF